MIEAPLISFFVILLAAVFSSTFFARLHLPWAVGLMLAGIFMGPYITGIFVSNETITFMGEIGLVFLMFMAGLEMRFSSIKANARKISIVAFINGVMPFFAGLGIGLLFDFSMVGSILLGIIFVSSSVAAVVPSLKSNNLLNTRIGDAIIGSTMMQDIASLIFLSILLQTNTPATSLPLPLFYILLFSFLVFLRKAIPHIEKYFAKHGVFQQEFRSVLFVIIGTVVIFQLLGLHSIIAGFFAGLVLSETLHNKVLKGKLNAVSYGLFIPIFFIVVGAETNLEIFTSAKGVLVVVFTIVFGSIFSKLTSGYFGGLIAGYTRYESSLIASTSVPQLSTTLAAAFSGYAIGLITSEILTALVILSIFTSIIAPIISQVIINQHRSALT